MKNRLFIAEKPSLGKAIAAQLPGPHKAFRTHVVCGNGVSVTWAFGHLYELAEPDTYLPDSVPKNSHGKKRWRLEDLPIVPGEWIKVAKSSAKDQLTAIRTLVRDAHEIVNAGDPDREGQLLIDEILEAAHWRGPTKRIWLAALDPESIDRALATLRDNTEYAPLRAAAEARGRADWLVGMNLSRAYTLKSTGRGVVSIGRVQTPTLALVVRRDREIENFRPVTYYVPWVTFAHPRGSFRARWVPPASDGEEETTQITDKRLADAAAAKALAAPNGRVASATAKDGREPPPLPLTLSTLQAEASRRYGLSAQETLDAAQSLYETHKILSYPRTDCPYLPVSQHALAARVRDAVADTAPGLREAALKAPKPDQKTRAWDDSKITAHHGLSPTVVSVPWDRLTEAERAVYTLAARAWLAQFYPDHTFRQSHAIVQCGGEKWEARGRVTRDPGWKVLYTSEAKENEDEKEEDRQSLPAMTAGDGVRATGAEVKKMVTKPPAAYTDGTLIAAMSRVHQLVTNPKIKARLKETSGLATEATRANILETLLTRDFIRRAGKKLVSTERGRALVDALPEVLTDPGVTGLWEDALQAVATNTMSLSEFEEQQRGFVIRRVQEAISGPPLSMPDAQPNVSGSRTGGRSFRGKGSTGTRRGGSASFRSHSSRRTRP